MGTLIKYKYIVWATMLPVISVLLSSFIFEFFKANYGFKYDTIGPDLIVFDVALLISFFLALKSFRNNQARIFSRVLLVLIGILFILSCLLLYVGLNGGLPM